MTVKWYFSATNANIFMDFTTIDVKSQIYNCKIGKTNRTAVKVGRKYCKFTAV